MSAGQRVEDARGCEWGCLNTGDVGYFASGRAHSEVCWVEAIIALLTWAPPVESRPKLHGPSPEALARGLVVGAVVRPDWRPSGTRMTVLGHSMSGHVATCDGLWRACDLAVVLPPPALDSWLLDEDRLQSWWFTERTPSSLNMAKHDIAAEARRLVELVRGGAR